MDELYKKILEKNKITLRHHFFCVITLKWYDQWIKTFQEKLMEQLYGHLEVKWFWL